jgi:rhamnogalacturonyl hydrolase YesR
MKESLFISACIIFLSFSSLSQEKAAVEMKLRTIADAVLNDASFKLVDRNGKEYSSVENVPFDADLKIQSAYNDWRYWNGILNIAMLSLGQILNDSLYIKFPEKNISFSFNNYSYFEKKYKDENRWNYPFGQFFIMEELDDCGAMGAGVIEEYKEDKQEEYKKYIDKAAEHIMQKQDKLNDGTLVRSFPYKWTLWADDLYMGLSFISRMGALTADLKYFDFASKQVINFHKYLFDDDKELMYHCWYSDIKQNGVALWGRANGWAMIAQIDLLERLPQNHPQRDTLIELLRRHVIGISKYQGTEGLWHQLLDKPDSYLETSCSAMFVYTIARAVSKGFLDKRFSSIALKGWGGLMSKILPDGKVEGVCTGTPIGDDLTFYYLRPAPLNDIHGIGTVILAGTEILKLLQ